MARANQLPGLQAGEAASLPLRCAVLGVAAGPWRHSSASLQLLLILIGICLVQMCVSALTAKSWGLSTVTVGTRSWRALASLPQVGMKEKGKGASVYTFGGKAGGNSLLPLERSTESCCFLNNGGHTYAFPGAQSHMGEIFSLTKPLLKLECLVTNECIKERQGAHESSTAFLNPCIAMV